MKPLIDCFELSENLLVSPLLFLFCRLQEKRSNARRDGAARLWLNGREVKLQTESFDPAVGERPLTHHATASGLRLVKGENLLVLKVCTETGRWSVGLCFRNPAAQPERGYRVATAPHSE